MERKQTAEHDWTRFALKLCQLKYIKLCFPDGNALNTKSLLINQSSNKINQSIIYSQKQNHNEKQ